MYVEITEYTKMRNGNSIAPEAILARMMELVAKKLEHPAVQAIRHDDAFPQGMRGYSYSGPEGSVQFKTLAGADCHISRADLTSDLDDLERNCEFEKCAEQIAGIIIADCMAHVDGRAKVVVAKLELPGGMEWAYSLTDKDNRFSMRMIRCYDICEHRFLTRFDILYGILEARPAAA